MKINEITEAILAQQSKSTVDWVQVSSALSAPPRFEFLLSAAGELERQSLNHQNPFVLLVFDFRESLWFFFAYSRPKFLDWPPIDPTCPLCAENLIVDLEACCELGENALASLTAFGMQVFKRD